MDLLTKSRLERAANLLLDCVRGWRSDKDAPRLSLSRMITNMSTGRLHGQDSEYLQETARENGVVFDANRPFIAFRDLQVAAQGASLVGIDALSPVFDILRPYSVIAQLGVQVEDGLIGNTLVPRETVVASSNVTWFSNEVSTTGLSTPTLGSTTLTPKIFGLVNQYSRQAVMQTNADRFLGLDLLRGCGAVVNQVAIRGASANSQPLGVTNVTGTQSMSGAALSGASCNQMLQLSSDQNAADGQISFLGTATVRRILQARERSAGSGFVWDNNQVSGRPAAVSSDVPSGTLICGPWNVVYIGIWGRGFVLEVNPYDPTGFKAGLIQARMILSLDVAVRAPGAFVIASSVT